MTSPDAESKKQKPKVVFVALYTTTILKNYWKYLKHKADCWWITFSPYIYDEIKEMGCNQVLFENHLRRKSQPFIFNRALQFINSVYTKRILPQRVKAALDELTPNIIISDTTQVVAQYVPRDPKVMKTQVFHAVTYKKYYLEPEILNYDLVLLPSEYYKNRICERHRITNGTKLKVVGWSKSDNYIEQKCNTQNKDHFIRKFSLNPRFKTVLYAPTYGTFCENGLFPKSFGTVTDAFEEFCKRTNALGVNVIIKLHPLATQLIKDIRLHKIADKYHVLFASKIPSAHLDTSPEHFLGIADVLISDVSGIILNYLIFNKPIVYIEPDAKKYKWEEADLPKEFRAGDVVNSMDELILGVVKSLQYPDEYKPQREEVLGKVFYKPDGRTSERASQTILDYYEEFSSSCV